MRVTRAIREFVEEEIRKKYDAAAAEIGKDYEAEKQKVMDVVTKIMYKAQQQRLKICCLWHTAKGSALVGFAIFRTVLCCNCIFTFLIIMRLWRQLP